MSGRFIILSGLMLAGCAVGPDYEKPALPTPSSYSAAYDSAPNMERVWWRGFEDQTLNVLIERAMSGNLDIEIAQARLAEAREFVSAERSDLFPSLDGFAEGQATFDVSNGGGSDRQGSVGALFSFSPDIFGGQRRRLQQARATAKAFGYDVQNVRRLTASAVASQYIEYRRTGARLELLETSLELQNETLEIVKARQRAGLSADLDVRRATADLARTTAQRGTLTIARARAEHALALLLGEPPIGDLIPASGENVIPSYQGGPPAGVPADLLRRRPDILAAEAELVAATAGIGVEASDLYPALNLPGTISADFGDAASISENVIAVLSASLDVPLFDAGRRRAEVRAAEQRARTALLIYERTLLQSLGEVENALAAIESLEDRREELAKAVTASEEAFGQLNALYREGLATFIDILDAQRTLIASREAYVDSEADLASAVIAFYIALGHTQLP